jgi:O-antigen/teichoic acid export membrane protein
VTPSGSPGLERRLGSALMWLYITAYSGKLLVFASVAILARVLTPEDFALVAIVLAMLVFADGLEVGVGSAIIYFDREEVERTRDAAFTLHVLTSMVAVVGFWLTAPLLADVSGDDRLEWIIRLLSLHLLLRALGQTHENLLRRDLDFRSRMVPEFFSGLLKGVSSIVLALGGAGVWALVFGQLIGSFVRTTLLWVMVPFRPRFDLGRDGKARRLLGYGAPLLLSGLIANVATNIDYLVVGNVLGLTALGYYTIAYRIPRLVFAETLSQLHVALFPFYSRSREEGADTGALYLASVRVVGLVVAPIVVVLTVLAGPTIAVFFGDGWSQAALIMPGLAIGSAILSVGGLSGDLFKAQGRPLVLPAMVLVFLTGWLPALIVLTPRGADVVSWAFAGSAALWCAGYWTCARRFLATGYLAHLRALGPALLAIALAVPLAAGIDAALPDAAALALGVPVVFAVGGGVAYLLSDEVRRIVRVVRRRGRPAPAPADVGVA